MHYLTTTTNIIEIQSRNVNFAVTILNTLDTSGYSWSASRTKSVRGGAKTHWRTTTVIRKVNTKRQTSGLECLSTKQFVLCFTFDEQIRFVGEKQPILYKKNLNAHRHYILTAKNTRTSTLVRLKNQPPYSLSYDLTIYQRVWWVEQVSCFPMTNPV